MRRSFSEFTKFLASVLGGDEAHVRHCIRRCREADLLARGKSGGGTPALTSADAVKGFLAVVAATRPIDAPAALYWLTIATLSTPPWTDDERKQVLADSDAGRTLEIPRKFPPLPDVPGLPELSNTLTLPVLLIAMMDARRADPNFSFSAQIWVCRGGFPASGFSWPQPGGAWETIRFSDHALASSSAVKIGPPGGEFSGLLVKASCNIEMVYVIADWLEGKAPSRRKGKAKLERLIEVD